LLAKLLSLHIVRVYGMTNVDKVFY